MRTIAWLFTTLLVGSVLLNACGAAVADDQREAVTRHPQSGRTGMQKGPLLQGWLPGRGLDDPTTAEVHVVLNDHGPAHEELMPDMIRTYRGGCTDASLPAGFPEAAFADGRPGPNTCRLHQVVVFR